MERTTVRLPSDLLARARKKAAAEGRTLTSLIEDGLRREVDHPRRSETRKRGMVRAPISSVFGPPETVDVSSNAKVQDLMDEDIIHQAASSKLR